MESEVWQLVLAVGGVVAVLLSGAIAAMQFIVRGAVRPLEESVARLDTKIDALGTALRAEMAELRKELRDEIAELRAEIAELRQGLHELAERVARLEGARRMESRVGTGPPPA